MRLFCSRPSENNAAAEWTKQDHEERQSARSISRRAGDDDPAHIEAAAAARLCAGAAHQAELERFATDRRRIAVSGAAKASQGRVGESRVGHFRNEPPRAHLQTDRGGNETFGA